MIRELQMPTGAVKRMRELTAAAGARAFFGGPARVLPVRGVVDFTRSLGSLHPEARPGSLATDGYRSGPADAERINCFVLLLAGDVAVLRTEHDADMEHPAQQVAAMTGLDVAELPGADLVAVVEGGELVGFELAP